ncbi:hypothetical protein COCOBI_14-2980 [Coccomyxa sp. Obi]|nr:hypothetical protein COCOBI_14-2980 [Coccomyxa sp. Obi]
MLSCECQPVGQPDLAHETDTLHPLLHQVAEAVRHQVRIDQPLLCTGDAQWGLIVLLKWKRRTGTAVRCNRAVSLRRSSKD